MKLDWELKYYDFDAEACRYKWHDIRMVSLRSELESYPEARLGDLMVSFRDSLNSLRIIEHFNSLENFRHGCTEVVDGRSTARVILAPL